MGVPLLLLISLDGFRHDYLSPMHTPNLYRLAQEGSYFTKGVRSQFPSKTMPNHVSILTGLQPAYHGIVGNVFYDPVFKDRYDYWNFTQNQTRLLSWFTDPKTGINCGLYYMQQPDHSQHQHGVFSPPVLRVIADIDAVIGHLLKRMKELGLYEKLNLIITADHGMIDAVYPETRVPLGNYSYLTKTFTDLDYYSFMKPENMSEDEELAVYNKFQKEAMQRDDLSSKIFAFYKPDLEVEFSEHAETDHDYLRQFIKQALLVLHGPAFRCHYSSETDTVENVDLFALMCTILKLKCPPSNASLIRIQEVLANVRLTSQFRRDGGTLLLVLICLCLPTLSLVLYLSCLVRCPHSHVGYKELNRGSENLESLSEDEL